MSKMTTSFYSQEEIPEQGQFDEVSAMRQQKEQETLERIEDLPGLVGRCNLALKWIDAELAIANNVFQNGHKLRSSKLGDRQAVKRLLEDLIVRLSLDMVGRNDNI
jgi:hypothetical protein